MNLFKRAKLYTIRKISKTLMLFFVLILVSTLVLSGITVKNAVSSTTQNMQGNIARKINLERIIPALDHESRMDAVAEGGIEALNLLTLELFHSGDFITFELLEQLMQISGIVSYNLVGEYQMRDVETYNFNFMNANEIGMVNMYGGVEQTYTSTVHSASYSEKLGGFLNGNLTLVEGRHLMPDDEQKVLISTELAAYNNLNVGDILKLSGAPSFMGDTVSSTNFELEIVGLFSGTRLVRDDEREGHVTDRRNLDSDTLIIDMITFMLEYSRSNYFGSGVADSLPGTLSIFIENPDEIDFIYSEILYHERIYGKSFAVTRGSDGFECVLSSMNTLVFLIDSLIVIIVVVSIIILGILLTIWTRSRVKEIGIYLANGIKKGEILSQFILESLIIAIVAFSISYPIGHVVSNAAGNFIVTQFSRAQALRAEQLEGSVLEITSGTMIVMPETGFMDEANIDSALDMIEISVARADLVWVYVIGLSVVIVSVLIASHSVMKLKPKQILSLWS